MVMLALSGGGSRAAYYCVTADEEEQVLIVKGPLDVQDINQLTVLIPTDTQKEVAELKARLEHFRQLSQPARSGRKWKQNSVQKQMKKNYQARWIGNWFWPWNVIKYWCTAYDRADIRREVLAMITGGAVVRAILKCLGLPQCALVVHRGAGAAGAVLKRRGESGAAGIEPGHGGKSGRLQPVVGCERA